MQGYYVAGMYVSGDHLCHANVDVAGFWRNLKSGGRVWVNSFQRNVQGLGTGFRTGLQGKRTHFTKTPGAAAANTIGRSVRSVGNAAGRVAKQAKWIAGVNKTNAKIGYNAGKYGWDRKKLVGNSVVGNASYAVGRASKHISDAANTVKEWGSQQIGKARDFISKLFNPKDNTVGGKIGGFVQKAVSNLKETAGKAITAGKSFMQQVFEAVNSASDWASQNARRAKEFAGTTADNVREGVGKAVDNIRRGTRRQVIDAQTGYNLGRTGQSMRSTNTIGGKIGNLAARAQNTAETTARNARRAVGDAVDTVRDRGQYNYVYVNGVKVKVPKKRK